MQWRQQGIWGASHFSLKEHQFWSPRAFRSPQEACWDHSESETQVRPSVMSCCFQTFTSVSHVWPGQADHENVPLPIEINNHLHVFMSGEAFCSFQCLWVWGFNYDVHIPFNWKSRKSLMGFSMNKLWRDEKHAYDEHRTAGSAGGQHVPYLQRRELILSDCSGGSFLIRLNLLALFVMLV